MPGEFVFLYVPFPSMDEALRIADILMDEKLVACANIFPSVTSVYTWEGKRERAMECVMIAKTTAQLSATAQDRTEALHSYDTPCVAVMSAIDVNSRYGAWLNASVG